MVAGCQSRLLFLAAEMSAVRCRPTFVPLLSHRPHPTFTQLLPHRPKNRVRGFSGGPSGRKSRRGRGRSMFTPGLRACGYKNASGLGKWPNRDLIGETGFELLRRHAIFSPLGGGPNCYLFTGNNPIGNLDILGLCGCGPDVAQTLVGTLADVDRLFNSPSTDKEAVCKNFNSAGGWDITGLLIHQYTKRCGESAPCAQTVTIDGGCYNVWTVNYLLYGKVCRLCQMSAFEMNSWILGWKTYKGDGQLGGALDWANAGYSGWPGSGDPKPDRPKCPACSNSSGLDSFQWHAGGMSGGHVGNERP